VASLLLSEAEAEAADLPAEAETPDADNAAMVAKKKNRRLIVC
jgi:hypothetical protein